MREVLVEDVLHLMRLTKDRCIVVPSVNVNTEKNTILIRCDFVLGFHMRMVVIYDPLVRATYNEVIDMEQQIDIFSLGCPLVEHALIPLALLIAASLQVCYQTVIEYLRCILKPIE